MNKSLLITGALLAAPISGIVPLNLNYAYAAVQSRDLYLSRVLNVQSLLGSRRVRVGLRLLKNANSAGSGHCTGREVPDSVSIELLDAQTLEVLGAGDRFFAKIGAGVMNLRYSGTTGCGGARYGMEFVSSRKDELRLHIKWDQEMGIYFEGAGWLGIRDGEIFTFSAVD